MEAIDGIISGVPLLLKGSLMQDYDTAGKRSNSSKNRTPDCTLNSSPYHMILSPLVFGQKCHQERANAKGSYGEVKSALQQYDMILCRHARKPLMHESLSDGVSCI